MFCKVKSFFIEDKLIKFYHLYKILKNKKFAKKDLSEFLIKDMDISIMDKPMCFDRIDICIDNIIYIITERTLGEQCEVFINGVKVMITSTVFFSETIWIHKNLKGHFKTLRKHSAIFKKINKKIALYLKQNDDKKILKEAEEKILFNGGFDYDKKI